MNKIKEFSDYARTSVPKDIIGVDEWIEHYNKLFADQIIGETVLAILATDTRDLVYTTFDKDQVDATMSRIIDQVRNHFKETNE